jgi:serine/threonine protein kinase
MLDRLEFIHSKNIIHRDIKPDNFMTGRGENEKNIYIIDFGLAKKFRSSRTLVQYPYIKKKKLTGTARYASIHALEEYEQSRRDDLESVGYVLLYFLRGSLPWQGLKVKTKEERYQKILEKKKETTSEELCKNFPEEFQEYVTYTRNLGYTDDPDYDMLKGLFSSLLCDKMGENFDFIYDWTTQSDLRKRKTESNNNMDGLSTSVYQISEKKSIQKKESESILSVKRKNETTNGNNYVLFKSNNNSNHFMSNNNIDLDIEDKNGNNVFIENKDNDNKVESKCCLM